MRTHRRDWLAAAALAAIATATRRPRALAQERIDSLYIADELDSAVQRGVEFLRSIQGGDGAIADRGHAVAMTSMSVMAMAAIGSEPTESSDTGQAMRAALDFVLQDKNQNPQGYFGDQDGSRMYGQGITSLMLTEMLGMGATVEQNARIHEALIKALELILAAQQVRKPSKLQGGWRYTPTSPDSDLSVSVWQVMALRSAKNDGLNVPGEAIDAAVGYLRNSYTSPRRDREEDDQEIGGFSYTPDAYQPSFTMTAAGLLAMQVCGEYDSPLVAAASRWLLANPPKVNERYFYYGLYYYAQGMHQVGGEYAETAEKLTRELLLDEQRDDGSWLARGEERNVGLVYATCLAILSLSVRYHYLPIYQR